MTRRWKLQTWSSTDMTIIVANERALHETIEIALSEYCYKNKTCHQRRRQLNWFFVTVVYMYIVNSIILKNNSNKKWINRSQKNGSIVRKGLNLTPFVLTMISTDLLECYKTKCRVQSVILGKETVKTY